MKMADAEGLVCDMKISDNMMFIMLNNISRDKAAPTTRRELMSLTGLSDRAIRYAIQDARSKGYLIISSTKSAGYYYTTDPAEIKRYISQQEHYIMNISRGLNAFRKYVSIPVGQMEFKG